MLGKIGRKIRENWAQKWAISGKLGAKTGKLGANIILYSACKQLIFNTFREFFLTPVFRLIFFLDSISGKLGAKTGKLGANIILYSACKQLIFNTFREFFLTPVFRLIFFLDSLRESLKGKRLLSPLRGEAFFP